MIINFSALPWLLNLLSSSKKGIRKEACWTISNITAGNKEQIQAVIEANIIPPLIQLLSNAEFDIRKVLCCALCTNNNRARRKRGWRSESTYVAHACLPSKMGKWTSTRWSVWLEVSRVLPRTVCFIQSTRLDIRIVFVFAFRLRVRGCASHVSRKRHGQSRTPPAAGSLSRSNIWCSTGASRLCRTCLRCTTRRS